MRSAKKFICILLVLLIGISALGFVSVSAEDTSGSCGDNLTWSLSEAGVLTISGSGAMTDQTCAWNGVRESVRAVCISKDVTHIGSWAFADCPNLNHVLFEGTQAQWNAITIGEDNGCLTNATRHVSCTSSDLAVVTGCSYVGLRCAHCARIVATTATADNHSYTNGTCTVCGVKQCWEYSVSADAKVTITAYTGADTALAVPAVINDLPVVAIGEDAFYDCDTLLQVQIPEGITLIDTGAFYDCTNLQTVTLPGTLTELGDYAFFYCEALTGLDIPAGVTRIGENAFTYCTALSTVTIPQSVTVIDDYAFYGCTSLTEPALPEDLTAIGSYAFYGCVKIKHITVPAGVQTIGNNAFQNCTGLITATILDGPQAIASRTFSGCTSLKRVTIPESVTLIGNDAFYSCSALQMVYYYGDSAKWQTVSIQANNTSVTSAVKKYNAAILVPGDMNDDDLVSDADALYLLRYTLFPDDYPIRGEGDLNGDGVISDIDALFLLRHTLFPDLFPLVIEIN